MTKAKTNALDALRTLIAERQQYEQWMSSLELKREGTAEQVYDRVQADYKTRLERVVTEIRGHAEELQLSISTLSSRLVEVARDEDMRREGLQEAELRAAVGEYEPNQWDQLRSEAEKALEKIAADRASLDGQLGELRAIQKLSEAGSMPEVGDAPKPVAAAEPVPVEQTPASPSQASPSATPTQNQGSPSMQTATTPSAPIAAPVVQEKPAQEEERLPHDPAAAATATAVAAGASSRARGTRTPPGGTSAVRSKPETPKADNSKTLKCPECGTPNYPTEWYCERCGGELATM